MGEVHELPSPMNDLNAMGVLTRREIEARAPGADAGSILHGVRP